MAIFCADIGAALPSAPLDLVVFSEIGYYFSESMLRDIALGIAARMQAGGEFVAVHWLGHSDDHVMHGDTVHEALKDCLPLQWRSGVGYPGFRIDTWVRA